MITRLTTMPMICLFRSDSLEEVMAKIPMVLRISVKRIKIKSNRQNE